MRRNDYGLFRDTFEGKDTARTLAARVRFRCLHQRCRQASEQKRFFRPLAGWAIGASQVWQVVCRFMVAPKLPNDVGQPKG